ncbi:hypothetical protein [Cellulomonas biazotea]|jgi:hypothetical protein|uniref:Uncharacterized protein n=1 Tax=Cellulomonas biazotea TaxID=1709 RepID=A0A402DWI3_9CELL|nr:hypothetical protein [Cellulomonas biazotea]GCE78477.1 hypothetical protein CBZ_35330 [Cellulomonas biazotea]
MDVGTLTVVVAATTVLAARAVVRVVRGSASFPALGVAALVWWLALTAVGGYFELRHHHAQAAATAATRLASGVPDAQVVCRRAGADWLDLSGTLGMVRYDDPQTSILRAQTCARLGAWLWSTKHAPSLDEVVAVHVVSHEAHHVAGEFDEGVTECRALRSDTAVAERMGASPVQAQALAARYVAEAYPYQRDEYLRDCSTVP